MYEGKDLGQAYVENVKGKFFNSVALRLTEIK